MRGDSMNAKSWIVLLLHALVGWALCFATIGIGMALTSLQMALIIHAVGAPIFFWAVSQIYFTRFHYTSPLFTALVFTALVILIDFLLVALLINRSLDMFRSLLGTWIPFALIFLSTLITGMVNKRIAIERSSLRSRLAMQALLADGALLLLRSSPR